MYVSIGEFVGPTYAFLRCHRCNMDYTLEGELIEDSRQFEINHD